jgi:ABC-type transport system involved in multi-copper enzyme maturation permease subunit
MSGVAIQGERPRRLGLPEARASFAGLVRGELRKIRGLRTFWAIAGIMALMVTFAQILLATGPQVAHQLRDAPLDAYANAISGEVAIVRILSGILALILAAHVIGLEYQQGTIRIMLGRGVGRLQLLGAKSLALALVVVAFIVALLLLELAFLWGISVVVAGASQPWRALTGEFWTDIWGFMLYLLINAGVTLSLGIAASVLGRSLAFGLAVGLSFFAVDNLAIQVLRLLVQVTHNDLWRNLSGAFLGPLLNRLPDYMLSPYHVTVQTAHGSVSVPHMMSGFGGLPLIWVGAGHAYLVIGLWSLLFAVVAIILTVRRDVLD